MATWPSTLRCCLHGRYSIGAYESVSWLHSAASGSSRRSQGKRGPSGGKLVKNLSPASKQGTLEVAPFKRDVVPHHDASGLPLLQPRERRPPSQARLERAKRFDERPRGGRWAGESQPESRSSQFKRPLSSPQKVAGSTFADGEPSSSTQQINGVPYVEKDYDAPAESDEFYHPPTLVTTGDSTSIADTLNDLPKRFTSPPLLPGFVTSLKEVLGPDARPTPIQSLSLKWLFDKDPAFEWNQFLLASETGSGKSIAYLLPVLQNIKEADLDRTSASPSTESRPLNPRAIILAPTHELSRQLSSFAKSLLHHVKLRVLCASKSNTKSTKSRDVTASEMAAQFDELMGSGSGGEFEVGKGKHAIDVVVGTPMKIMEMVRGRGWDRQSANDVPEQEEGKTLRRGRDKMTGFGKWRSKPELGLANVEWVIVDEADVLLDPDFQEVTRSLLADISAARGHPVSLDPFPTATPSPATQTEPKDSLEYPFHLLLTSATIPSSLARYLDLYHPRLIRLASPRLHHLPKTLQTEYAGWTGGNKNADIEKRLRKVWAEDAMSVATSAPRAGKSQLSKVLIFCNRSSKVIELSAFLGEKGIRNVALTSAGEERRRGSNKHLEGFLRPIRASPNFAPAAPAPSADGHSLGDPSETAHVMITTSLLSRGLDFDPSIKHVFIVDEPRNMIDFLHRAGRSGRAGQAGRVVIFGKTKGRGSDKARQARKRVGALL